tara:strand:+ start:1054 stop:1980 length:927 start_codon:yes stop_codon:yes gene_type:complete
MVILLGSTGYIGKEFKKQLDSLGVETYCPSRNDYNYYQLETLKQIIHEKGATFLINCAGYVGMPNVDECEHNQDQVRLANVSLVQTISKACLMMGIPWAHISSGCIYNGESTGANGFTEKDMPNFTFTQGNSNYYSMSKSSAEEIIQHMGGQYYIWRFKLPFDQYDSPKNLISKLMNYNMLFAANNSISHKGDCVKYCLQLWQQKADFGIYNVVNSGSISTKEITDKINKIFGINRTFKFFENQDQALTLGAVRAYRSHAVLDNTKLRKALHPKRIRPAIKAIEHSLKNWKEVEEDKDDNGIPKSFWD